MFSEYGENIVQRYTFVHHINLYDDVKTKQKNIKFLITALTMKRHKQHTTYRTSSVALQHITYSIAICEAARV